MKINHVTTSFYSPGSNGKVERLHRFMHDILAKKIKDDPSTWDVYLNQTLAAIRCSKNESTKFSPFFLLYNRDPVLPVDNLLKPRRKYAGESPHQILLEQQHKSFVTVHRNLKKAKSKQKEYADKNRQEINFKVGDAVYFKNHLRKGKLDSKWKPFYRIIEQRSPVSFIVKNQLTGSTTKVHAQHLKPAPVETWDIPKSNENKKLRKSRFVVPPESSESEMEVDPQENETVENRTSFRNRLIRKNKHERDTSSDEDEIPLMELKKRINIRNKSLNNKEVFSSETDEDDEIPLSKLKRTLKSDARDESDVTDKFSDSENMSVNSVNVKSVLRRWPGIEDLGRLAEAEIIKGQVNLIIHEFSHIAYSGCKETLEKEGLKPSIIKRIFKTWNSKARVFHESNMLGETMRDSFETFLQNPEINLTPSYIRDLVKSRENAAKRRGETTDMKTLFLVTLLFCLGEPAFISENVVFDKINSITTTRSNWLVTFVTDLKPFDNFIKKLSNDIVQTGTLAQEITRRYDNPEKEGFKNTFSNLRNEFRLLTDTHTSILRIFNDYKALHRNKRSVLPIIGKAMHFLFGTLTDSDVSAIKGNIRVLADNQNKISHVLAENLSILNVTRIEVSENRHAINSLIGDLRKIDSKLENVTEEFEKQIIDLENYIQQYVQLDLITGELKLLMQKAMFYLEHLGSQLNMLSLGHLSPSTITPTNLKRLLNEIKNKLPRYLDLSEDPNSNLWFFYRLLTCTTVLYDDKILAIISLPLLDSNNRFEVYKAYNLPMPMKNNSTKLLTMVAKFDINVEYFAVNAERSKYVLLKNDEINKCTDRFTKFCKIVSPVYPINLSKNCVISLFMKKEIDIDKFCKVLVEPSSILPMASYISSGSWLVTTNRPLNFAIACQNSKHKTTLTKRIFPPINILTLNETCTATNDFMTLLPFYNQQSKFTSTDDSFIRIINDYDLSSKKLWKPFHQSFPKFNLTKLPKTRRGGGEKVMNFAAKYDKVGHLVSAKTEGEVTTNRDVASAPMLVNHKDDTQNNIYPVLKLPIIDN
ncbi:unnamed protein product [Mytilus coruscus]|uniref:Integrase catalytic domain-containing protein n=1 Tax=Mytilus coruscus TaxID=42192 RepID=A0A6J8CSA6_MYTCO|nr:unnamed protein product [Mytilus coruscus]